MESLSVQKSPKRPKGGARKKTKPMKVVYISNPMRVTTSAAAFRSLVQKLTGRDSTVADMDSAEPYCYAPKFDLAANEYESSAVPSVEGSEPPASYHFGHGLEELDGSWADSGGGAAPLEAFDEVAFVAHQMPEGYAGRRLMPAALFYEPQQGVSAKRKLN